MAAKTVDFFWNFPDWYGKVTGDYKRIQMAIAASMQTNRALLFDKEGAYNGRARWAPLKMRDGMILSDRGVLRQSIGPRTNGKAPKVGMGTIIEYAEDTITIGTRLLYARLMNDGTTKMPGGVMKPVNAKALKIPVHGHINQQIKNTKHELSTLTDDEDVEIYQEMTEKLMDLKEQKADAYNNKDFLKYVRKKRAEATAAGGNRAKKMHKAIDDMVKRNLEGKSKRQVADERFIFRKSVKIPARKFDDWTNADEVELALTVGNLIVSILNGK